MTALQLISKRTTSKKKTLCALTNGTTWHIFVINTRTRPLDFLFYGKATEPEYVCSTVFTAEEVVIMKFVHRELYTSFHEARKVRFQNAYGKLYFFFTFVGLFCQTSHASLAQTPKGEFQPGSLCVNWVTSGKNTRSGTGVTESVQERVADFVVENQGLYTVGGEIKTNTARRLYQNLEQMVGLLQKDQKVMLGLVVNMAKISPQILVVKETGIQQYTLPPLLSNTKELGSSLTTMAEMMVYFNSF